jgi:hypothetical protein
VRCGSAALRNARAWRVSSAWRIEPRSPRPSRVTDTPVVLLASSPLRSLQFVGGTTTFASACYIMALNPLIVSSTGVSQAALFYATALSAGIFTFLMVRETTVLEG